MSIESKNIYKTIVISLMFIMLPAICFAEYFSYNAAYDVCFTPDADCAKEIIKIIKQAKEQILVQAYSFSDLSIAGALAEAKRNGVDVRIILDKSQAKGQYNLIKFLKSHKIKPIIDSLPRGIAHNKTMVVDNFIVIGGSYNYSKSAAKRNAENMVIIQDTGFAQKYVKNWYKSEQRALALINYKKE